MYLCKLCITGYTQSPLDCQDAGGPCCYIWCLLVTISRVLPLLISFSWSARTFLYSTCFFGILLVGYVQCYGQSHRLLFYEPQVSNLFFHQ